MTVKNDTSDLAAKVEDLTEMLNRVRSVIRGNLAVNLDPSGELQMTREEYEAKMAELQKISDEHDARRKALAAMHPDAIQAQIEELESASLRNSLSGLGVQC